MLSVAYIPYKIIKWIIKYRAYKPVFKMKVMISKDPYRN